jgi:hypothetical protein
MAEPKWTPAEREWIKRAAQEAGPHTCTYSRKELARRRAWMKGLRRRTLEKKRKALLTTGQP